MNSNFHIIQSPSELGSLVRKKRKEIKMSQTEVALLCGVGVRFVSDLENGKTALHLGKVMQVLHGMGFILALTTRDKTA